MNRREAIKAGLAAVAGGALPSAAAAEEARAGTLQAAALARRGFMSIAEVRRLEQIQESPLLVFVMRPGTTPAEAERVVRLDLNFYGVDWRDTYTLVSPTAGGAVKVTVRRRK